MLTVEAPVRFSHLRAALLVAALGAGLYPASGQAWIYPEHRDITAEAIARLPPAARAGLERLWSEALPGLPEKLCRDLSEGEQGLRPGCIDFAAFPAFSGDHSCSPKDVLEHVLPSGWILGVARVGAETKAQLAVARSRERKLNVVATSNLKLQIVDPEYATRAGSNNAHFMLPRRGDDLAEYLRMCLAEGAPLNALGLYGQYHVAALALAQRLAAGGVPEAERAATAGEVIVLEGFALHWLQDIYASGHEVGTWGSVAWRKGTHDYYSEFGVDSVDWAGRSVVAFGDANMQPADLDRASIAVAASLTQLSASLRSGDELGRLAQHWGPGVDAVLGLDACKAEGQPTAEGPKEIAAYFVDQVQRMSKPSLGPGQVHIPRFRDELGPFVSVYGTAGGGVALGGVAGTTTTGSLGAGARIGYGADSLTGLAGTGILFLEAGLVAATADRSECGTGPGCAALGPAAAFPRVAARTGLNLGIRLPFWIVPGDMLVLGPVLALAAPRTLSKVGVEAASGGFIPYERTLNLGSGTIQVILGREFRVSLFGYVSSEPVAVAQSGTLPDGTPSYVIAKLKEIDLQFPVLEWTPFRTFATQLTFATPIQLGFSVGLISPTTLYPADVSYSAPTLWSIWLRGIFDGRYFFGSREDLESPR